MNECGCREVLISWWVERCIDVHIMRMPAGSAVVTGAHQPSVMTCPHGVMWVTEPTGEQLAQWAKDRTP